MKLGKSFIALTAITAILTSTAIYASADGWKENYASTPYGQMYYGVGVDDFDHFICSFTQVPQDAQRISAQFDVCEYLSGRHLFSRSNVGRSTANAYASWEGSALSKKITVFGAHEVDSPTTQTLKYTTLANQAV